MYLNRFITVLKEKKEKILVVIKSVASWRIQPQIASSCITSEICN